MFIQTNLAISTTLLTLFKYVYHMDSRYNYRVVRKFPPPLFLTFQQYVVGLDELSHSVMIVIQNLEHMIKIFIALDYFNYIGNTLYLTESFRDDVKNKKLLKYVYLELMALLHV